MSKSIFKSKTFWANVIGGTTTAIAIAEQVVPPAATPYVVAAGAITNILLRFVTTTAVTVQAKEALP